VAGGHPENLRTYELLRAPRAQANPENPLEPLENSCSLPDLNFFPPLPALWECRNSHLCPDTILGKKEWKVF
jgi:hypothetical protein